MWLQSLPKNRLGMMLEVNETFTTIWLSRSSEVRVKVRRWPQFPIRTIFHILLDGVFVSWQAHTASCPQKTCFVMWLSGMRMTWPTHRSCALTGMPQNPWCHRCVAHLYWWPSCHLIPAILRKQQRWNWSSLWTDGQYHSGHGYLA